MMTDILRQAAERAAQQSENEQAALARILIEAIDHDAAWAEAFADPRTPEALEALWAEALEDVRAGRAKVIEGDEFDS